MPAICTPDDLSFAEELPTACAGVFVDQSAAASGDGSRGTPFKTVTEALVSADASKPIYLCATALPPGETIALPMGAELSIFGGLECGSWARIGEPSRMVGMPDAPTLTVVGVQSKVRLEDLEIVAQDAIVEGGSSIAVLVANGSVELARCDLRAGDGFAGEDGVPYATQATSGPAGTNGQNGCLGPGVETGGEAGVNTCDGTGVTGGFGGSGTNSSTGGLGSDGENGGGIGGTGQSLSPGTSGADGAEGVEGANGPGGTGIGLLDAGGYLPAAPPASGEPGTAGRGGGGGGGAHNCQAGFAGPGGGGGGAGGCGGGAGNGGAGGGASFALAVAAGIVTLVDCTLTATTGGSGGGGGDGQAGGNGGFGGSPGAIGGANPNVALARSGGYGGSGGRGGRGGGGVGGPSAAIARTDGASVIVDAGTAAALDGGTPSAGGIGANNGQLGLNGETGAPGSVCGELVFDGSPDGACNQ